MKPSKNLSVLRISQGRLFVYLNHATVSSYIDRPNDDVEAAGDEERLSPSNGEQQDAPLVSARCTYAVVVVMEQGH